MCPCYSGRTHYPTLEKPNAQIFSSNANLVITEDKALFLKKITGDDAKKTKRLLETQVLTKDFASCKIRYKPQRKRK